MVIPEEAEFLILILRAERRPKVHLIAYAAPVTKNMLHFNGLSYYVLPRLPDGHVVPAWLSIEIGILAGRLYVEFAECDLLTKYLRLGDWASTDGSQNNHSKEAGGFTETALHFLLEWLTVRRRGNDITHTPMGYICRGRRLNENHPFFATRRADAEEVVAPSVGCGTAGSGLEGTENGDMDSEAEEEWDPMDHHAVLESWGTVLA